jgi:hypothetical protein
VPKSLSAPIVLDLYPTAAVGLVASLQGQCDVAKVTRRSTFPTRVAYYPIESALPICQLSCLLGLNWHSI